MPTRRASQGKSRPRQAKGIRSRVELRRPKKGKVTQAGRKLTTTAFSQAFMYFRASTGCLHFAAWSAANLRVLGHTSASCLNTYSNFYLCPGSGRCRSLRLWPTRRLLRRPRVKVSVRLMADEDIPLFCVAYSALLQRLLILTPRLKARSRLSILFSRRRLTFILRTSA